MFPISDNKTQAVYSPMPGIVCRSFTLIWNCSSTIDSLVISSSIALKASFKLKTTSTVVCIRIDVLRLEMQISLEFLAA